MRDAWLIDAGLASRARTGDVGALAQLLERHRPSLYAAAVSLLRNREEARDAVQEACVVALVRIETLHDPAAVSAWLQRVLRNVCLMRLRSTTPAASLDEIDVPAGGPSVEEALERLVTRDWVWTAIDQLTPDDRITLMLRHFTRSNSYQAIASVTGVPVGTVRSRLSRARAVLAGALEREAPDARVSRASIENDRRDEWEGFYAELHDRPVPRTYRATYAADVEVTDRNGRWRGVREWSAHEREAIALGVRATIVGLAAGRDVTVLEIDFTNPDWAADHCPPRSTFVHRLEAGRSRRLDIHYV